MGTISKIVPIFHEKGQFMQYIVEVSRLSKHFYEKYPKAQYPEILEKESRTYACLLIEFHEYFICIPYRTNVLHANAYHFKTSKRSVSHKSGLDYSKIAIINNKDYIENQPATIDKDEYNETMINIDKIVTQAITYVEAYIKHINQTRILHQREFFRKYNFSTLPYFHDILGL